MIDFRPMLGEESSYTYSATQPTNHHHSDSLKGLKGVRRVLVRNHRRNLWKQFLVGFGVGWMGR